MLKIEAGNSVTCLVISGELLCLFGHLMGFLFGAYLNFKCGFVNFFHCDCLFASSCGKKSRLVEKVFKVCAREAYGCVCNAVKVNVGSKRLLSCVNLENFGSALCVGIVNGYLTVKSAGSQKCGVKDIGAVCGGNNDYAL